MLGYHYIYETPMCPSHMDTSTTLSIATISKIPIEDARDVRLPETRLPLVLNGQRVQPYDRYGQVVTIAGVDVVNVHPSPLGFFGYSYESGPGRNDALAHGRTFRTMVGARPAVFMGDFNADNPLRAYRKDFRHLGLSPALQQGLSTVPWGAAPDQILVTEQFRVVNSAVVVTNTDHYLVWADLFPTTPELTAALSPYLRPAGSARADAATPGESMSRHEQGPTRS